jgi:hypothetical protein
MCGLSNNSIIFSCITLFLSPHTDFHPSTGQKGSMFVFLFLIVIVTVNFSCGVSNLLRSKISQSRIALLTQGKASYVTKWMNIYNSMKLKEHVTMFFLSYDEPIDDSICGNINTDSTNMKAACIYRPHTTWTEGRNLQAQHIAHFEHEHKFHFKFWQFADIDVTEIVSCGAATNCKKRSC